MNTPLDPYVQSSSQAAEELRAKLARDRELDDLRWLVGHAQGRRLVWRLLEQAGIYRSSFSPNGQLFAHQEGRRSLGCWLLQEITEASPDAYPRLLLERAK